MKCPKLKLEQFRYRQAMRIPIKMAYEKENSKKVQPPGFPAQKTSLGGPISLGPTQDPFWDLKSKIYYKKHIFGAFVVFMKNKFVSHFLDFV